MKQKFQPSWKDKDKVRRDSFAFWVLEMARSESLSKTSLNAISKWTFGGMVVGLAETGNEKE